MGLGGEVYKASLEGISQKVLTESLKSMEADGLIIRKEIKMFPPMIVEYSLSPLGETLEPILQSMQDWGKMYKERLES